MTRLLLDFPWTLDEDLDAASGAYRVLRDFVNLFEDVGLEPVPFIDPIEYAAAVTRLKDVKARNSASHIYRNARQFLRRPNGSTATATPEVAGARASPSQFTVAWKQALRDELGDCQNWRSPQILFAKARGAIWPKDKEVAIRLSDRSCLEHRILSRMDRYDDHPLATADLDPWRACEWINQPPEGNRVDHPCRLPRPRDLLGVPLRQLAARLAVVRQQGWRGDGRLYYIPPENWTPEDIPQARWRGGRAFPWESTTHGSGPLDYRGQVWVWHRASAGTVGERHWDVQLSGGGHQKVSHDGRDLGNQ